MSVPTLRWLQIHHYEQFDPVRIECSPRENLILGINGAGKTQLLRLIRAVLGLDFGELLARPFDVSFELASVAAGADDHPAVTVEGRVTSAPETLGAPDPAREWVALPPRNALRAELRFRGPSHVVRLELRDGMVNYTDETGRSLETLPYRGDGSLRPQARDATHHQELRDLLDNTSPVSESCWVGESDREFYGLTNLVRYRTLSEDAPEGQRFVAGEQDSALGRLAFADYLPLLAMVTGSMGRDTLTEGVEPRVGPLPGYLPIAFEQLRSSFRTLRGALGVVRVRLIPRVVRQRGSEIDCRGIEVRVRFQDGTQVAESELTFGQRRFLYAGLVSLARPWVPVVVDEIDNGLHPRLVEILLELWKERQLFLATHNKLVLDATSFSGAADVQQKIHLVHRREDGRQALLPLDDTSAQEIHEKLVEHQRPSDVLRSAGLW